MSDSRLGRRIPPTFEHVNAYPLRTLLEDARHEFVIPPAGTEKNLGLPWWWKQHDQGQEGACVGFGSSAMMSITNHAQRLRATGKAVTYRYDARWLYLEAQLVDYWEETPPEEGTSVDASCQILHKRGHRRVQNGIAGPETIQHGIAAYRWATTVDEIRAAIHGNCAVSMGVNWYEGFHNPALHNGEWWIGRGDLGSVLGGHCICIFRMSDRREAFRIMNSWGDEFPPSWISYAVVERLIDEYGEFAVITDR